MNLELHEAAHMLRFDASQGWPEAFTPDQLVDLQLREPGMLWAEFNRKHDVKKMRERLRISMNAGLVDFTSRVERKRERVKPSLLDVAYGSPSSEWLQRGFEENNSTAGVYHHAERKFTHISAPAFAEWLAKAGIEPSTYALSWFKSQGVSAKGQPAEPAPAPAAQVEPAQERSAPETPRTRILKKAVLIRELKHEWPSIERDLSEASRNGLNESNVRRGYWDPEKARQWADSNGKLKKAAQVHLYPATFASQFHRLAG